MPHGSTETNPMSRTTTHLNAPFAIIVVIEEDFDPTTPPTPGDLNYYQRRFEQEGQVPLTVDGLYIYPSHLSLASCYRDALYDGYSSIADVWEFCAKGDPTCPKVSSSPLA